MIKYLAFVLDDDTVTKLKRRFQPAFPNVTCHHVTIMSTFTDDDGWYLKKLLDERPAFHAFGVGRNGFIDAAAVMMGGKKFRTDGVFFHCTLSFKDSYSAKDSRLLQPTVEHFRSPPLVLNGSFQIRERNP